MELTPSQKLKASHLLGCGLLEINNAAARANSPEELARRIQADGFGYRLEGHSTTCEGRPFMKGVCGEGCAAWALRNPRTLEKDLEEAV